MKTFQGTTMSECTVQLWYNKQRVKKGNNVSLYLEIIVGRQHKAVRLQNLKWPVQYVDWERKQLLPRSKRDPDLAVYNAIIERERAKYWSLVMKYVKEERNFTLRDILNGSSFFRRGVSFFGFMEQAIIDRQKTLVKKDMIKFVTGEKHLGTLKKFKGFLKDKDLSIISIDSKLLERFADHLRKSVCENTVWMRIQQMKSYLSYAARNGLQVNNDYKKCVVRMDEADPVWLNEGELNVLLDLYIAGKLTEPQHRNLRAFLFASFTGLRISDLSRWNKSWIKGDKIEFIPIKRRKSARPPKPLSIPILPEARKFIESLEAETFELPSGQKYNEGLKLIAKMAGIEKNLTSHVARHTFATWMAMIGVMPVVISKILGHKNLQTTQVYIHISDEFKAIEMMKLQMRFGRRPGGLAQPPDTPLS